MIQRWALGWACLAAAAAGCGKSGTQTWPVSGTVTWQGQAVPKGTILFESPDGSGVPDVGQIADGKFSLQAQAGKRRVKIHADREEGPVDPAMGAAPRKPYIPARYNSATELSVEVKADGKNEFDFPLK